MNNYIKFDNTAKEIWNTWNESMNRIIHEFESLPETKI